MPHIQTITIVTDPRGGLTAGESAEQSTSELMSTEQNWQVDDATMHEIEAILRKRGKHLEDHDEKE